MIVSPEDWDRLAEPPAGERPAAAAPMPGSQARPGGVLLVAAALGDLVALVSVCALALLALRTGGHRAPLSAFPWVASLAVLWWCAAATVLVVVRRGTPGMLMAGVGFVDAVAARRVAAVLAAAMLGACSLGLPALLGAAAPLLHTASGTQLGLQGPE
jgi:hypothetical protein